MIEIRNLEKSEHTFLLKMLYESIYLDIENKPPMDQLLNTDSMKKYYQDWGRKGDKALIAVDECGNFCGAVWYRLFCKENPGYGFVSEHIPELGIAIEKEYRGKGLGKKLMNSIIEEAKNNGFDELSLSVDANNSNAIQLYDKIGFIQVGRDETSLIMLYKC